MRSLAWTCTALVAVMCIMSLNLWRELRVEQELAASLRMQIVEVVAGSVAPEAPVTDRQ